MSHVSLLLVANSTGSKNSLNFFYNESDFLATICKCPVPPITPNILDWETSCPYNTGKIPLDESKFGLIKGIFLVWRPKLLLYDRCKYFLKALGY